MQTKKLVCLYENKPDVIEFHTCLYNWKLREMEYYSENKRVYQKHLAVYYKRITRYCRALRIRHFSANKTDILDDEKYFTPK